MNFLKKKKKKVLVTISFLASREAYIISEISLNFENS